MRNENGPAPLAQGDAGPENSAAAKPLGSAVESTAIRSHSATVTHLPLAYSQALIDGADGPIPEYGSVDWQRLPDADRCKVAAIVVAAERWRTGKTPSDLPVHWTDNRSRRIQEARRPRPGDHPGGPVPWEREAAANE